MQTGVSPASNKKLILSLIKNDITNTKLLNGLSDLGFEATEYLLTLNEIILELIGFDIDRQSHDYDKLFDYYLELIDKATYTDVSRLKQPFDKLSTQIYNALLQRKKSNKKHFK